MNLGKINCKDLYDNAAERLKGLDNDIDKTIQDLAKKVETRGVPKNKVARQVVKELTAREVLSPSRIYEGLGIEHKRKYKKREIEETFPRVENISTEESTGELRNSAANEEKNVPEQKTMTVDTVGYEEAYEDTDRGPNVRSASEVVEILKKELADVTSERDSLSNENKIIKEKTQPELLRELQEKFYDEPGLLDAKQLQKISEKAGRDLETIVQRCNTIIQNAVDKDGPVPLGTYIITKPDMKLVPVRIFINFDKKKIVVSLWEKKLT